MAVTRCSGSERCFINFDRPSLELSANYDVLNVELLFPFIALYLLLLFDGFPV